MNRSALYILAAGIQIICFFFFRNDPFFGDAISSTYQATFHIYQHGLTTIFYPETIDPGHPTLYAWLLAAVWQLTSPSLWITHLYASVWMLLFVFLIIKLSLRILPQKQSQLVLFLLVSFGTFLSLSAMVLNTTALMLFVGMSIYGLRFEKNGWLLAGNILMVMTHLQGVFFVLALFTADGFMRYQKKELHQFINIRWVYYAAPATIFATWMVLHFQHSGWFLHSPHYSDSQDIKGVGSVLKSLALIVWRIVDYGMLPVIGLTFWGIIQSKTDRILSHIYLIVLGVNALLMALFLEHTIGHRYFFVLQALAILLCVQTLFTFSKRLRNIWIGLVCVNMVAGNFLYYPGKTIGDATLLYRKYFGLEKEIVQVLPDSVSIYSYAPIANPSFARFLHDSGITIHRITSSDFSTVPIILQSNINAEFTPAQKEYLSSNWYGKSFESGPVFVNVFLNPKFFSRPKNWHLRTPGALELQLLKWKTNWR